MPAQGGVRTPLTASYSWGQSAPEAQFGTVFEPRQGMFSPGYPPAPAAPERLRLWDFPIGVNAIYTPRAYEPVSFDQLRSFRILKNHVETITAISNEAAETLLQEAGL